MGKLDEANTAIRNTMIGARPVKIIVTVIFCGALKKLNFNYPCHAQHDTKTHSVARIIIKTPRNIIIGNILQQKLLTFTK